MFPLTGHSDSQTIADRLTDDRFQYQSVRCCVCVTPFPAAVFNRALIATEWGRLTSIGGFQLHVLPDIDDVTLEVQYR